MIDYSLLYSVYSVYVGFIRHVYQRRVLYELLQEKAGRIRTVHEVYTREDRFRRR
jgi:hypothetical protein